MKKKCSMCGRNRKLKFFARNSLYSKGRYCWCEDCVYKRSITPEAKARHAARWKKKMEDPEFREKERLRGIARRKADPRFVRKRRNWAYKRKYGISLRSFEEEVKKQKGKCKLCLKNRRLCADHIPGTKKFRGALCWPCNLFIGQVEKVPGFFRRVVRYLGEF